MNLTIIEPHGDDAFISCSSTLMNPNFEICVWTMSDRSSEGLREFYPSIEGTTFVDAKDVHYDYHLKYNTHDVHKRYIAGEKLYDEYIENMDGLLANNINARSLHIEFLDDIMSAQISDILDIHRPDTLALLPVGLFHPNHYATRKYYESILYKDTPRIYYVDKPYIEKRYMKEIIATSDFLFYTAPVQDKDTRAKIFKKVYPTEQSLLRFSSESILEWKDIYAIRKSDLNNPLVIEFLNNVSDMKEGDKYENIIHHVHQD